MSAPAALSPDQSSCSSDTGDVLIRSTRVLHPDRTGPGGRPGPGSVQITVRKLRDFRPPPLTELRQNKQRRRSPRQNPDIAAPHRSAAYLKPRKLSGGGDGKLAEAMDTGDDVLTSRFASGGRGVVLAALKQRSHSAPRRREVRVHFLDPMPLHSVGNPPDAPALSSQDAAKDAGVQMETPLSSGDLGDASSTAAAAATAALAAAAPLFKAQSDMEARVAQLADGIQKLLQADREGGDRGRSMSQQTLQHLEMLQCQQVQLQSQLLESALRIASGHASDPPTHLQVTHLDAAAANSLGARPPSSLPNVAVPPAPVTMETHRLDQWADQTRYAHMPERSQLQSLANHSWEAARRANDMLQEMKRLKTEMKMLLTQPEDPLKTSRPAPKHQQSQQTQSQQTQSQQTQSQQTQSQQTQSQQTQSQSQQTQSQQTTSKENRSRSQSSHLQQNVSHENSLQSQQNQSRLPQPNKTTDEEHNLWSQQSQSVLVQRRSAVPSLLEEAGQVLRQVRKQKKVLEENVEALLRARTGEVLHCQLEALAANRDHSEEVRVKKTVDAWISRLSRDIQRKSRRSKTATDPSLPCHQAEMSSRNISNHHSAVDADSSAHSGKERPVGALRGTGSVRTARRGSRGQRAGIRAGVEPNRGTGGAAERHQLEVDGESYLTRLYGRAPYEGLRRTLKKSPYLRLSSPASPLGRKPRPRLVESVRGVKLKSSKTQTSLAPPLTQAQPIISAPPFASSSPGRSHIFSSSHLTSGRFDDLSMTPANSCPVAIAIPLGPPRMDSRCEHPQEVTSALAAPPTASVGDEAPDQLLEAEQAPPPPRPPSHTIDIIEGNEEEEDDFFPGTDFLSVVDVVQQEVSVSGEEAVELDGGPSPPPVLYQGPIFPPQAPSAPPAQDQVPVLGTALQRDVLETRLVEWVEQQLMSRMISELYWPPPSDHAHNSDVDQSDPEERSVTSDIVEAAGDAGLQLFVDASVPVDSELIRQLVNEVLAETVALMLGQREPLGAGPAPALEPAGPADPQENEPLPLVPTPEPTPPPSPAPPSRETTAVTTPPPSEPTSPLNKELPQPIAPPGASELVATPTLSPEPTPSAESPATVHQAPPPFTWEETELPLDEERLVEDITTHRPPLFMSVEEEEPPLSSPHPPPPPSLPPARSPSPPPEAGPASPSTSSEESSSSSTVTAGTEAALKHISEGELLISANQLAAMTGGGAACSFNSSLQELQDMDFDPPSEGQVKGRDLLRALLTKMEQGVTQRGARPQPEGSWGRADGNVSFTHSGQSSSPGQISQAADVSEISFEATNQGSFTLGDLTGELIGTLTSDLHTELSLSPPPHLENTHTPGQVLLVRTSDSHTARQQEEEGGSRKMGAHLPAVRPPEEEEEVMEASVSAAADSDSSTSDVF
ncbi:protein TALPID3 isoform X4 [Neolamprologus brichardi]|uniref:protein TALPID3 isoform X4 n=1 Tax=Neolamprologus brichardi TaxID=32507 RepID=UPI001643CBBD|nr:protein TALPID3 isoform X4 [Neolamprologus brichardi]